MGKIYNSLGKALYRISILPLRIYLGGSNRVYGVLVFEEKVLLIKNWYSRQDWRLPGGGVKKGEEPIRALKREVFEEIGLNIEQKDCSLVDKGVWSPDKANFNFQVYSIVLRNLPELKPRRGEIIEYQWFSINELPALNPQIEQSIKKASMVK